MKGDIDEENDVNGERVMGVGVTKRKRGRLVEEEMRRERGGCEGRESKAEEAGGLFAVEGGEIGREKRTEYQ